MNTKKRRTTNRILIAVAALLLLGSSVLQAKAAQPEFSFALPPVCVGTNGVGENQFSSDILFSRGQAVISPVVIAITALLACMILIKRDEEMVYRSIDKASIALNFLIAILAFPFIFMASLHSEMVAVTSVWQQILYFTPALTVLGIVASVAMRRCGYGLHSLLIQFIGPILFAIVLLNMPR